MRVHEILYHTFLDDFGDMPVVIDAGGHEGEFSKYMSERFNARTYLLEPVPALFSRIEPQPNSILFQEALIAEDGEVVLDMVADYAALHPGVAPSVPVAVPGISLRTLLGRIPHPEIDLAKIDIEGSEIDLLEQAEPELLKRMRQITVEFHDFLYAELGPRVEGIKRRLEDLGFYAVNFSLNNGDVLFVRRDRISYLRYLWLKYPVKYARGLMRRLRRIAIFA